VAEKMTSVEPENRNLATRAFHWLDRRTGADDLLKKTLDEPIPGGARMAYVFGSGLLFIFILQVVTGICLALYYVPSAEAAHPSVAFITKQVAAGAFLRSLHSYGSSAMIIVLALHFLQTFLYGSFKGRRELLWISGALLSFLILGMGFTGYLLPWDQKAYFATTVGTNIVSEVPVIGNWLMRLLRGGDTIGTLTLSRFYVAHVFLIPAGIFMFIGGHILMFRKAGPAGPVTEDPVTPRLATETFYPRQVLMDMGFALLIVAALAGLAYFHPASLGPVADPADTQFLPRPEWYYLPMFEWLKLWEGPKVVFGVIVLPGLLAMMFFLLPFLDRSLERKPWRRPIPVLAVSIVVLGMVYLGVKSRLDDKGQPSVAAQIAFQEQDEKAFDAEPFEPQVESPGAAQPVAGADGARSLLIAQGKGVFGEHGCSGCHGGAGMGTALAPSLVGVTTRFPEAQLMALVHSPNAKMRAGGMPATDLPVSSMSALVSYLGVLGTSAANIPAALPPSSPEPSIQVKDGALASMNRPRATGASVRSDSSDAPAHTLAGQQMFQDHACFACHGPAGTGGRAPALAGLIAKLTDGQLAQLLQSPSARMKAGGMQAVEATPESLASLIFYLRSLRAPLPAQQPIAETAVTTKVPQPQTATLISVSTNGDGHPASEAREASTGAVAEDPGRALFVANGCAACHGSAAQGTQLAPALVGVGTKFPGDKLPALLRNPTIKMRSGGMPQITLNDAQLLQLMAYLTSLEPAPKEAPTQGRAVAENMGEPSAPALVAPIKTTSATRVNEVNDVLASSLVEHGQRVFQRNACETCHGVGGVSGTVAAPGLAGTASGLPEPALENLLQHHSTRMKKGGMPATSLNARDMKSIVAYIRSLNRYVSAVSEPR
jgi:ubiquinol-cytochrome c reductase cytochrome b subunit